MPVTYAGAVKTARMQATADQFDSGTLEIQSAGGASVLAIFPLGDQAAAVAADAWTVNLTTATVTGETAAGGGTDAAVAVVKNSVGTTLISGLTVALTGADVNLDNINIANGQNVTLSSAVFTHAPDP